MKQFQPGGSKKSERFLYVGFYSIRSSCSGFDYNESSNFGLEVLKSVKLSVSVHFSQDLGLDDCLVCSYRSRYLSVIIE